MPIDPNLTMHPLTLDTVPDYVRIRIAAYANTINKIVFEPDGPNPTTIAQMHDAVRAYVEKGYPCFVVKDSATGEIIAAAKWHLVGKEVSSPEDDEDDEGGDGQKEDWERVRKVRDLTDAELEEELQPPPKWHETPQDMWDALYGNFAQAHRDVMGNKPFWSLDNLVTHPFHERRGAASLLVSWGCARSDSYKIPLFLTASCKGQPVYARAGYEVVGAGRFDPVKEVGRDVGYVYEYVAMVREPRGGQVGGGGVREGNGGEGDQRVEKERGETGLLYRRRN